ncbi:hypothetical protein ACRAWD_24095 [Caulobacter segnis]
MKPPVRILVVVAGVGVAGLIGWRLLGPDAHRPHRLSGLCRGRDAVCRRVQRRAGQYGGPSSAATGSRPASRQAVRPGRRPAGPPPATRRPLRCAVAGSQLRDAEKGQRPQRAGGL